jgi:hypothetical protein
MADPRGCNPLLIRVQKRDRMLQIKDQDRALNLLSVVAYARTISTKWLPVQHHCVDCAHARAESFDPDLLVGLRIMTSISTTTYAGIMTVSARG